ncbi:MAG TPA: hypothetical protein VHG88_14340 [Burkholderiales bacterium]|nr:hypothetical protein [Burkholderiales bacterium]
MTPALWTLLALFALRVLGQAVVAFFGVDWLPAMPRWYSGLMPYPYLLPSQVAILALMAKVCLDFTRGRGFFVQPRRFFAGPWLWFGWLYFAVMLVRLPLQLTLRPDGPLIPIFFHWALAAFVILVGLWHRARFAR